MQQKWDDIDNLIIDSMENIEPSYNYNSNLINKIHEKKNKKVLYNVPAVSLIFAGVLMMVICTNGIQYKIIETKFKIKSEVMAVQHEISNIKIMKNIFGE